MIQPTQIIITLLLLLSVAMPAQVTFTTDRVQAFHVTDTAEYLVNSKSIKAHFHLTVRGDMWSHTEGGRTDSYLMQYQGVEDQQAVFTSRDALYRPVKILIDFGRTRVTYIYDDDTKKTIYFKNRK